MNKTELKKFVRSTIVEEMENLINPKLATQEDMKELNKSVEKMKEGARMLEDIQKLGLKIDEKKRELGDADKVLKRFKQTVKNHNLKVKDGDVLILDEYVKNQFIED